MRSVIRSHPAASYFVLAFAISWGGILVVIRGGAIPAPAEEAHRLFVVVYLAMLAGPSIAGIAMTAIRAGVAGLRRGVIDSAGPIQADNVKTLLLLAFSVGLGAGFFEELGWTGFAIPSLLERLGGLATGLVVGVLWGAWHFLAVWWGSASSFGSVPVPLFLLVALFTFLPPYRLLMVRVYERTGSLLIAILMHASLTASMIILGPAVTGAGSVIYNLASRRRCG